jgi:hypothetical protein
MQKEKLVFFFNFRTKVPSTKSKVRLSEHKNKKNMIFLSLHDGRPLPQG